ncbi:MAG: hypothetical protein V7K61_06495 [Nostoc sp.]
MDAGNHQPLCQVLERSLCKLGNTKAAGQFLHHYICVQLYVILSEAFLF